MSTDYSTLTDAQLAVYAKYETDPAACAAIEAEQKRREGADDGSHERVARLMRGGL